MANRNMTPQVQSEATTATRPLATGSQRIARRTGRMQLVAFLSFAATIIAFYPGVMRIDSVIQYTEAVNQSYSDWHPPVMAWLWSWMDRLWPGPFPMLLMQASLYWCGIGLLAGALAASGRRVAGWLVLAAGWSPISLGYVGVIFKDVGATAAFVASVGLVAHCRFRAKAVPARLRLLALVLISYGVMLRFNTVFAALPLIWLLFESGGRHSAARCLMAAAVFCAGLLAMTNLVNYQLLGAQRTQPVLSAITYDLGGITYFSGEDQFKPLGLADLARINREVCYSDYGWDIYFIFECSVVYEKFKKHLAETKGSAVGWWLASIARHPIAYLKHRLAHFNSNLRLLLPHGFRDVTYLESSPNPYGFVFEPNALTRAIQSAGLFMVSTPMGWAGTWVAIAAGWLSFAPALARGAARSTVLALASSAVLYAGSYLVMSVASDARYHHWTILSATLACAIGFSELTRARSLRRMRLLAALLPALLAALAGAAWRAFDLSVLELLR